MIREEREIQKHRTAELTYRCWAFGAVLNFTQTGIVFPVRLSDWL